MPKTKQQEFVTAFSRYVVTGVLGEGGSGIVYATRDESGQKFAIKILKEESITSEKRKRFKNEIVFCQRGLHPNIIRVVDVGVVAGDPPTPFYVMPYYDSSLRKLMQQGIQPKSILPLFSQLLDGVEAAHLQGIVHRDLKPENILVGSGNGSLVLADFGIASFTEEELFTAVETKAEARLANFQYAAPEQRVRGRPVDLRADLYATGLMLNEMFTGEIPQGTRYKTISSISPDYSYLDEIVDKTICQTPDERLSSIRELKQLLRARGADYVSEQKLNQLKTAVVATSDVDDPLVLDPVRIEDFDWEKGQLTLVLSQPVNTRWRNALLNMGSYTSLMGKPPEAFTFEGNHAKIAARENEVQSIIDYFKQWMPLATTTYKQYLLDEQRRRDEEERQALKRAIEAEEAKARLRKNVKL